MKDKTINSVILATFFLSFLFIIFTNFKGADDNIVSEKNYKVNTAATYIPLAPIPGLTDENTANQNFATYLTTIFNWLIAISIVLAVLITIFGGIEYMTVEAISGKSNAKKRIQGAIAGLILALSAWLILYEINPEILNKKDNSFLNLKK